MTDRTGLYMIIFFCVFGLLALLLIVTFIVNVIQVIIARRQESNDDTLEEIE